MLFLPYPKFYFQFAANHGPWQAQNITWINSNMRHKIFNLDLPSEENSKQVFFQMKFKNS